MHLVVTKRAHAESNFGAEARWSEAEGLFELWLQNLRSLRGGNVRLQSADGIHYVRRARSPLCSLIYSLRDHDVGMFERRQFESRRQHADDAVRVTIDRDRLAQNIFCLPEATAPETIRDQRNTRSVRDIFVRQEVAPTDQTNAKRRQKISFHVSARQVCWICLGEIAAVHARPRGERLKRGLTLFPDVIAVSQHKLLRHDGCHEPH